MVTVAKASSACMCQTITYAKYDIIPISNTWYILYNILYDICEGYIFQRVSVIRK